VETAAGGIDWSVPDDALHALLNDEGRAMSAFWHGRRTYELMAASWPPIAADPSAPAVYAEFARVWMDKPKLVFSRHLANAGWNTTVMRQVEKPEIEMLKAQTSGEISVGGPDLAAEFLRLGLIDELRL